MEPWPPVRGRLKRPGSPAVQHASLRVETGDEGHPRPWPHRERAPLDAAGAAHEPGRRRARVEAARPRDFDADAQRRGGAALEAALGEIPPPRSGRGATANAAAACTPSAHAPSAGAGGGGASEAKAGSGSARSCSGPVKGGTGGGGGARSRGGKGGGAGAGGAGGRGALSACGSIASAAMSARAETTSSQRSLWMSRVIPPSPVPRTIRPLRAEPRRAIRTRTRSAASSGAASRARLVRRRIASTKTSSPGHSSAAW